MCRIGTFGAADEAMALSDEFIEVDGFATRTHKPSTAADIAAMRADNAATSADTASMTADNAAMNADQVSTSAGQTSKAADNTSMTADNPSMTAQRAATIADQIASEAGFCVDVAGGLGPPIHAPEINDGFLFTRGPNRLLKN